MKKDQVHIGRAYVAKVSGRLATVRIDAESRFGGWEATNVATGRKVRIKSAQRLRRPANAPHPERDYYTLAEFFPAPPAGPVAARTAVVEDDRPPQDIDERLAAAPPSIVPYEERRARAEAAQSEAAGDDGPRYDPSRCATPRCRGTPVMTYIDRPMCQACWDRHCADEQPSPVSENVGDACLPAVAGRPSEEPQTPEQENAMSKKKSKTPPAVTKAKGNKKAATPKAKATKEQKPKRVSALDAAATVLKKVGKPMRAQELIAAMAEQGLWTSPGGKTPHATLYTA